MWCCCRRYWCLCISKLNHTTPLSLSLTKYCSFRITSSVFSIHVSLDVYFGTLGRSHSLSFLRFFYYVQVHVGNVYWNKYCCRVLLHSSQKQCRHIKHTNLLTHTDTHARINDESTLCAKVERSKSPCVLLPHFNEFLHFSANEYVNWLYRVASQYPLILHASCC